MGDRLSIHAPGEQNPRSHGVTSSCRAPRRYQSIGAVDSRIKPGGEGGAVDAPAKPQWRDLREPISTAPTEKAAGASLAARGSEESSPLAMALPEKMEPVGTHGWAPRQQGLGLCLGIQEIGLGRQGGALKLVRVKCLLI